MVPPPVGKLLVLALGTAMWIWMQAYVKVQVILHGEKVLIPKNRSLPADFDNETLGIHKYVELNNITVHYVKKGCEDQNKNHTILLLLHGFLDFWFIWNRVMPILGEKFCVVAPDLRGYGNTTRREDTAQYLMVNLVEDAKKLVEHLNPENKSEVVLVGHDWGGMISFCFATLYESLISKMVIINGMHPMAFAKRLLGSVTQIRMSWYMLPFRHPAVPERFLKMKDFQFFDKVHEGFTPEEEYAHKYAFSQPGALTGALSYYRAFNNDSDQLKKLPYRKINVSTLILWGEKDDFITSRVAVYNEEWLRSAITIYYPFAGHWFFRECAKQVSDWISEFAGDKIDPSLSTVKAVTEKAGQGKCFTSVVETGERKPKQLQSLPSGATLPDVMQQ